MGLIDASYLLPLIVAIGVVLFILKLTNRKNEGKDVTSRVKNLAADVYEEYDQQQKRSSSSVLAEKLLAPFNIDYAAYEKQIKTKLEQSGIESPDAVMLYVFGKKFGPFIGGLLAFYLITLDFTGAMKFIVFGLAAYMAYLGFFGTEMYLKNRKQKRQYKLQRSFPDALDLILVSVEAGLAMDAALSRVCKELDSAHPEITQELNKTRIELTLLNDRPKALQNLAERTDMLAFRAFTGALLQSEKFGTSLTETLRVLSEDYRNTRMMMAENKANRLPALMTIPLMLCMMPALIMVLMAPAIITLVDTWGKHMK